MPASASLILSDRHGLETDLKMYTRAPLIGNPRSLSAPEGCVWRRVEILAFCFFAS